MRKMVICLSLLGILACNSTENTQQLKKLDGDPISPVGKITEHEDTVSFNGFYIPDQINSLARMIGDSLKKT